MTKNTTIFRNIKETDTPFYVNIDKILDRIKEGKSKDLVKSIRKYVFLEHSPIEKTPQ